MYSQHQTRRVSRPPIEPTERFREWLALILLTLFGGWLLCGLFLLTWQQRPWVLISSMPLIYPVYLVIYYYFGRGKR